MVPVHGRRVRGVCRVNKRLDHMKIKVFSVGTGSLVERCIVCATGHSRGLSIVQQYFSRVNRKGNVLWYSVRNTVELHLSVRWLSG